MPSGLTDEQQPATRVRQAVGRRPEADLARAQEPLWRGTSTGQSASAHHAAVIATIAAERGHGGPARARPVLDHPIFHRNDRIFQFTKK